MFTVNKYLVFLTNFGYFLDKPCDTLDEAIEYGRSGGFEFSVVKDSIIQGSCSGVNLSYQPFSA